MEFREMRLAEVGLFSLVLRGVGTEPLEVLFGSLTVFLFDWKGVFNND
jgi:hypothetical protein